jgi:hypothetical protein
VYANPFWPFSVGPFTGVGTFAEYLVGKPLGYGGAPAGELLLRSWIADFGARHYGYAVSMGGYGVQWLPVLVLAVIGAGTLIHGSRRPTFALANGYAALAIVASVAIALAVAPMSWWARLTLFAIVASLAFAVVALSRIPRRLALVAGATLAIAATWSVGVATATSNISIDSSGRPATMLRLAQLVMGDVAAANGLGMWPQCSAFERIPDGARVTLESDELRRVTRAGQVQIVGFGFNLPHLVVGHRLQRRLVARIAPTDDPVELRMRALAVGATHLVLITRGPSVTAARRDAAQFKSLGVACVGTFDIEVTEIFELVDTV